MDWYTWLYKSSLEPSLIYEYGLLFVHNELEEEDIAYFDHDFLKSMGISIAKHRLEILKLSRGEARRRPPLADVAKLVAAAMKKTKKCLDKYVHAVLTHAYSNSNSSAIVVVPKSSDNGGGGGRKGVLWKRKKSLVLVKQGRLMISNGIGELPPGAHSGSGMVQACHENDDADDHGHWQPQAEAIKWESMFQDLKPT